MRTQSESHSYRANDQMERFRKLGDKFGGYKAGIPNGPEPTTKRGMRRRSQRTAQAGGAT